MTPVSDKLKELICTELDLEVPEIEIDESTTPDQLPGWDSLRNVSIIIHIEKEYGVRLKMIEMLKCKNMGDLQKLVDTKIAVA